MDSWLNYLILKVSRPEPPGFLLSHRSLTQSGLQGKTLRKKIRSRREEDYFSANPLGLGLSGNRIVQKFAIQNAYRYLYCFYRKEESRGILTMVFSWKRSQRKRIKEMAL